MLTYTVLLYPWFYLFQLTKESGHALQAGEHINKPTLAQEYAILDKAATASETYLRNRLEHLDTIIEDIGKSNCQFKISMLVGVTLWSADFAFFLYSDKGTLILLCLTISVKCPKAKYKNRYSFNTHSTFEIALTSEVGLIMNGKFKILMQSLKIFQFRRKSW